MACSGDLNGDRVVTINELVTAVNAALDGCNPGAACPGDANADGAVTIDELIAGVNAALDGCPDEPSPTPSPTPVPDACPYALQDDTLATGVSCAFRGAFTTAPGCPDDVEVLLLGNGSRLVARVTTNPPISFGAAPTSNTTADLVAYFVDSAALGEPIGGILTLEDGGRTLTLEPIPAPPFAIGGSECASWRYLGRFVGIVAASE